MLKIAKLSGDEAVNFITCCVFELNNGREYYVTAPFLLMNLLFTILTKKVGTIYGMNVSLFLTGCDPKS